MQFSVRYARPENLLESGPYLKVILYSTSVPSVNKGQTGQVANSHTTLSLANLSNLVTVQGRIAWATSNRPLIGGVRGNAQRLLLDAHQRPQRLTFGQVRS